MPKQGYLYAACSQGNYGVTKIGYTEGKDPRAYLPRTCRRYFCPLEVIGIIPVSNTKLMEQVLHHQLRLRNIKRELFDLQSPKGAFNEELWGKAVANIRQADTMSGMEKPDEIPQKTDGAVDTATPKVGCSSAVKSLTRSKNTEGSF